MWLTVWQAGALSRRRKEIAIACIVGVFMAGVNRARTSPIRTRAFARDLGTILLHGLGFTCEQATGLMNKAIDSILV